MSGTVLLTGATGLLGMETLAQLIDEGERDIIALVRAGDDHAAADRLSAVLAILYDDPPPAAERVRAVRGDLLAPRLGVSPRARSELVESVEAIIHCAASISFDLPLEEAREVNVGGVARVLELAIEMSNHGQLQRMLHVSTAYVSGTYEGEFAEDDLKVAQGFRNGYERSKYEAEQLARLRGDLPIVIARPSIIVGHRACGWTSAFNVVYWPMRALERGLLASIPAREDSVVDIVPVDYVAAGLIAMLDDAEASGTYHLVAGDGALTARELVDLHSQITGCPPPEFMAGEGAPGLPSGGETLAPYFDVDCTFDDTRTTQLLARAALSKPDPREYLARVIAYARATGWGKRRISRQAAMAVPPEVLLSRRPGGT